MFNDVSDIPVPQWLRARAGAELVRPVWRNELGGITYELGLGSGRRFLKWIPEGSALNLADEVVRLRWAVAFTPVPMVLDVGHDGGGDWVLTAGLPGRSAVDPYWLARPAQAVRGLGVGLRRLHEALPVAGCPFSWSVPVRLADARARAAAGRMDPKRWHAEHRNLSLADAFERLADAPEIDVAVVGQGDACAPNTLLTHDGNPSAHVDLGQLGVADRWADLAIATWSTQWNYGPGWERTLLDAYGVNPNPDRIAYYRLLGDLDR